MQNEELRTAQAQIEAGRDRYYDLYDLAPVGYCTLSEQGLILEANLTAATLLGTTRNLLVKKPISRFILKDDQDIDYLHRKKLFDTGEPQECELRLVKPDSALSWAHLMATATQAEDGAPVCRVVLTDITERKKSMATLQRIEWMLSGKKAKDDDFIPEYGDLTELNKNGLILSSIGKDQLTQIASEYLDLLETSSAIYEINGDYALGTLSSGWCRMMDAASRKLCKTDDKQQAFNCGKWLCHESCWEASSIAIESGKPYDMECKGGINLYAVPIRAAGKIVGAINFGYGDPPEDDYKLEELAEVYQLPVAELREKAREYQTRPQYIIDYAKKRIQNSAQYIGNIIEGMKAEEEREKLQAQLNQAQKMESVGRLAGGVAHDFNNMLGAILGYTELALERAGLDESLHADLKEIRKAAQRSADLTHQLLAFARKQTIVPKVLDFNATVEGMLNMLRKLIGEDINLAWKPGRGLWPVNMDPAQIDQMMANLCVNARDAIAGVGTISVETCNITLDEEYFLQQADFTPGEYVMLTVSDDGCGMDAETLLSIFEPFFTTKEASKGTGLGLPTMYGIIKQNKGFINVYSEPGQGTTFNIYLPRYAAKTEPLPKKVPVQTTVHGHETILLVEDEPAILKMTTIMLERHGYTVLKASSPGEAIRLAREYTGRIDLLLTDVIMPEMNGRNLAENLVSNRPSLKCLFMSGYTANIITKHGVLHEGEHFIQKPFSENDLGMKLREALKG